MNNCVESEEATKYKCEVYVAKLKILGLNCGEVSSYQFLCQ